MQGAGEALRKADAHSGHVLPLIDASRGDAITINAPSGSLQRQRNGRFDLFLPMRPVILTELSGKRRSIFRYGSGIVGFSPPDADWRISWEGQLQGVSLQIEPGELTQAACQIFGDDATEIEWRTALSDHNPVVANLGLDMISQMISGYPAGAAVVELQYKALLALLARRYASTPRRNTALVAVLSRQVLAAVSFIDEQLHDDISVADIAEAAAVSAPHLNRLFQAELGLSVWKYVIRQRIKKASEYYRDADAIRQDAQLLFGFSSVARLRRAISKRMITTGSGPVTVGC